MIEGDDRLKQPEGDDGADPGFDCPSTQGATPRWIGYIDRIDGDGVHGWAYDSADPNAAVIVEAVTSTGKTSLALANLHRADVCEAGYGTGNYGFTIDPSSLNLGDELVVVRFAASKHPITREPIDFDAQRSLLTYDMPKAFRDAMVLMAAGVKHIHDRNSALEDAFR